MAVDRSEHLLNVLETHRMSHIDKLVQKFKDRRTEIKEALEENYTSKIYSPFHSGSFGKHTAVNIKFDLDVVVPFERNSFDTIKNMFEDVYNFLNEKYQMTGLAVVRKQKVSIGILFYADKDGDQISIDVVPGREISQDSYLDNRDLNIYFNDNAWGFAKGTYTKTNIQSQIDTIKSKDSERKIIRLLKIWKHSNSESYKSFLLELLTLKAFNKTTISGNLWSKLEGVLTYVKDNVTKDGFTLKDPGNSSNDLMTTLSSGDRQNLANKMQSIIDRITENSENVKTYFPVNKKFDGTKEVSQKTYGLKSATIGMSLPKDNQRFG